MSLNSSTYSHINTKFEAYRLIYDPTRLLSLLYSKYGDIDEDYFILHTNQLIFNAPSKFNIEYKEIKYTDLENDYLKRLYKKKESRKRIPKLSDYYKNYHLFFCRPTLCNRKLGYIMCEYQDNKAELFYKNNYQESKEEISEKLKKQKKNKEQKKSKKKNNLKKNSSISFSSSSLDNVTNNKIIFDKETKRMLDRTHDGYNNNYYNTLTLESSKSNMLENNIGLASRQSMDDSFEKCIHGLVTYQFKKNKNNNKTDNIDYSNKSKSKQKYEKKQFKRKKNIVVNDITSNNLKKNKFDKNQMSLSQRESYNKSNINFNNNSNSKIQSTFCITKKIKSMSGKNRINRANSNFNHNSKLLSGKKKKSSLFSLSNNKYINSGTNILNSLNNIINKKVKKNVINNKITQKNEENNFNHFLNNNKSVLNFIMPWNNNKNKTYILTNNNFMNNNAINSSNKNNIYSNINLNIHTNKDIIKNLNNNENNYKKFTKLTEYLKQTKNKDIKEIKENLIQKTKNHKKNSVSISGGDNKNIFFNIVCKKNIIKSNNNSRVNKKHLTIKKNLKIVLSNINNTNNTNNTNINNKKGHTKNKTFDYNTINSQTINLLKKTGNSSNINIDDFDTILSKPKKNVYKINTDSNSIKNNQVIYNKKDNNSKNKSTKNKNQIFSPSTKKLYNKIPIVQTESKEKSARKKNLIVKIFNPNSKNPESDYIQETSSPLHKNSNYSMFTNEDIINSNFLIRFPLMKSINIGKCNFNNSNCNQNSNKIIFKNISGHISPCNHLYNSNIISLKNKNKINYSHNSSKNNKSNKNNIYKINQNIKKINNKKVNNILVSNNNIKKYKEYYSNVYLTTNSSNHLNEKNILSRNKKKINNSNRRISKNNKNHIYNNSKKKNVVKSNSNLNNNKLNNISNHSILNNITNNNIYLGGDFCQNSFKNNVINAQGKINISIGENNINIKDSILHINKIYIKNNNINHCINNGNINNKKNKIIKINSGNNCCFKKQKALEIKVDDCRIKTGGNIRSKDKENIRTINFQKGRIDYSPKIINVYTNNNNNLLSAKNNNDIKIRYKKPNI